MTNSMECPQWHSSIFSRYINNEASPADLATLHTHFNECTICHQQFLAPLKEAMALASQDNLANEDAPAEKASWQLFKKDLIAITQQANTKHVSFDLAYHQLREAKSLYSQNIDYLASLANEDINKLPQVPTNSAKNLVEFPHPKFTYKRKQFLANVFKVAAIIILALVSVALLKPNLLKVGTSIIGFQLKNNPTRYDLIDQQIDFYLQARLNNNISEAETALKNANNMAEEMASKTYYIGKDSFGKDSFGKELFGRDLVDYYRNLASEHLSLAIEARKLAKESQDISIRKSPDKVVVIARQAKEKFEYLGAETELEPVNFMLAKGLTRKGDKLPEAQGLVDDYLNKPNSRQHILSYAQFLYSKSDILGETAKYNEEIIQLNESIKIATDLEVPNFVVNLQTDLTKIRFNNDENQKALDGAEQLLTKYKDIISYRLLIDLKQIAGMSSYNLNKTPQAKTYLTDSITLAEDYKEWDYLIQGRWMLALVMAQEHDFNKADSLFNDAIEIIPKLDDPNAENAVRAVITGYQAREQALQGKYQESVDLYAQSIDLAGKAEIKQVLMLSQLHQGRAEGLLALAKDKVETETETEAEAKAKADAKAKAKADADVDLETAQTFREQAQQNLEKRSNSLLAFLSTNRKAQESP